MKRVLVVDDEKIIVKGFVFAIQNEDTEVDAAYDGEEALEMIRNKEYDIVFLDVMLPKLDGFEVCKKVREFSSVPIIMVTAKNDDSDKIAGLNFGADDYITKPFNIGEVKARMEAILRRTGSKKNKPAKVTVPDQVLEISDMRLERNNKRLYINNKEVNITVKEFEVLDLLASNAGKVYSREKLLEIIWGLDYPGGSRTVDVHVRRLREKIEEEPSEPKYVQTKWGVGYYFRG
ncbi:MAG: response regulator transcription factor [Lachnospiraceae bacterium]|nr:response regulator transcription factor [Lachnospiraceae bacterium]